MKLYFNMTLPVWVTATLFVAMAILTIRLYRRHQLPKPWNIWLPALRIGAIFLLLLTLLQPVLVKNWTSTDRGRIAVLIDNSGSMSIADDYTLPEQVGISWDLNLYPRELRCRVFTEQRPAFDQLAGQLDQTMRSADALRAAVSKPEAKEIQQAAARLQEQLQEFGEATNAILKTINKGVSQSEYLVAAENRDPADRKGRKPVTKAAAALTGGGGLLLKRWYNIDGHDLTSLTKSKQFSGPADDAQLISSFDVPVNVADRYGGRVQGYIHPPLTGNYIFMISSDDLGQLFLSTSDQPEQKRLIAQNPAWCARNNFNKYAQQKSKRILLQAGKAYYVEAIYKEQVGADHCQVAWKRPDGLFENPIPGTHLSPYGRMPRGRMGPDFVEELKGFRESMTQVTAAVKQVEGQVDLTNRMAPGDQQRNAIAEIRRRLTGLEKELISSANPFHQLQNAADIELATAGLEEVDKALDGFAKMRRHDLVRQVLLHKPMRLLKALNELGPTDVFSLDEDLRPIKLSGMTDLIPNLPQTSLGSRQQDILKYYEDQLVTAIVVFSDGNNNAGKTLREIREIAREREVAIIGVGVGAPRPPRDIAIDHVLSPRTSFKNDAVNISVVLKRDGFIDRPVTLRIVSGGKTVHHKVVPPGPETRITVDMSFVESRSGILIYRAEAEIFPGEQLKHNNRKSFSVNVLKDPIRTLLVDEFPRWESRYCSMLLKRDPRVDLHTIFVASLPDGKLKTGKDGWPESRDELFSYQILVMGDVDPRQFTQEQLDDIRAFVTGRGGTVVFMAGEHHMPAQYLATPLADLLPLKVRERPETPSKPEKKSKNPFEPRTLAVADEGSYDSIVQIGSTPELSAALWERLPGLDWIQDGVSASGAADRLVEAQKTAQPVLLKANVGLGKVMYIGSDSFWRWRYRTRSTYHHRFWGQILLWATMGRTTGTDQYVKLMTSRPEYTPGETVEIRARLLDENELPVKNAQATAEVFARETGKIVRIAEFNYLENSGGKYIATVFDLPRGKYRIIPVVDRLKNLKIEAEASFEVRDLPTSEYVDLSLNELMLRSFTTGYRPYHRANEIADMILPREVERSHREEREIWDSFYIVILAAIFLGLEWHLRKRNQLV